MEQFRCEECQRDFAYQESLNQHNIAKHKIGLHPKKELNQIKKQEKVRIAKKPILKYALVTIIILIPLVLLIHHFSSKSPSVGSTGPSVQNSLNEIASLGAKAPDFSLPSTTGGKISLSDYYGKKNVLLYFQEGVMCDPCWKQIVDIEKEYDMFASKDIELVSITVDPLNALVKNSKRFGITTPILADEDLKVSTAYDILKEAMHPGSRPGHTFVLVDKNGNIVWKKAYFLASGSTKMTMRMSDGRTMTMDMGMDMGTPESVMYLPVERLLRDLREGATQAGLELTAPSTDISDMPAHDHSDTTTEVSDAPHDDHSMCLTPIHYHTDFKMYLAGTMLNFSQNSYMDQSNVIHFHKTVKVKPDNVPNLPNGNIIHTHKENATLREFLKTLDLPFNIDEMQNLKVYVNGNLQTPALDYTIQDKDRVLVTDSTDDVQIKSQTDSVTDYAIQGKETNPSLFGGC